ncbi:MAG: hypothetical protein ACJA0N_000425 [Pseudohongiellaceae bacterium]|jgi:hypothetical protein
MNSINEKIQNGGRNGGRLNNMSAKKYGNTLFLFKLFGLNYKQIQNIE